MSDATSTEETAPATDTSDTPEADTPTTPEVNWQERYEHLQPEYTRATQTLSDEEALIAHIQSKFPHLIDDDEPDLDPVGDTEPNQAPPPDPRVDELAAWQQQEMARQGRERYEADLREVVGERTLSDLGREWLDSKLNSDEIKSSDDLEKFVTRWFEHVDALKPPPPKARTPHVPTGGPPAPEAPAGTHQSRVERAMERMQAEQA